MIDKFTENYSFLSNFYDCHVAYEGIEYASSEAAFQAAKTLNKSEREMISKLNPSNAKKVGRQVKLREDWEEIKDEIMYEICKIKFTTNDSYFLADKLIATVDEELIEGNTWHDNYWGNCTCDKCKDIVGQNKLGKILMRIREELKSNKQPV